MSSSKLSSSILAGSSDDNNDQSTKLAISLLNSIYGSPDSLEFPLPMTPSDAGLCNYYSSQNNDEKKMMVLQQRRYLWTDAFAVLAYQTLAEKYTSTGEIEKADLYKGAVEKLIHVVHECLGKPRSEKEEDAMTECSISPTGYVGLRIGKVETRKNTDYGMRYDGQYWHYIDKWLFALARTNRTDDGIKIAKSCFPYFFSNSDEEDGDSGLERGKPMRPKRGGIRWKLSVDASSPPTLPPTYGPNDDTLNALIVFSMLEKQKQRQLSSKNNNNGDDDVTHLTLQNEINQLQTSLRHYHPRVTEDPLGWGLEALFDQFVMNHPRTNQLRDLAPEALHPSHLSLPFRLYGALIGARVVAGNNGDLVSPHTLANLVDMCVRHQLKEIEKSSKGSGYYEEEHASINRVMLAMVLLCPGVLKRRDGDPLVQL